jgi:tetratricopeptide (TPR) repeat protein
MKRTALVVAILSVAMWAEAQSYGQGAQQTQPAPAGQATPSGQAAAAPGATTPATKRPLQTKTSPEFEAWKLADDGSHATAEEQTTAQKSPSDAQQVMGTVALRTEKAADDFATKFPDSEVRILLYKSAMRNYQSANNPDKTEAMGRKTLSLDGDDPEALVTTAEVIVEKTRDSDIDRDQRYDEAMKMAQKSLTTVDTDISVPAGTTQERLDAYKSGLRSQAYSTMGSIEYSKNNFPASQTNFQKAVDAYPSQPFPADVLRLALALDKQQKYDEALKVANRAVELSPENTPIGTSARHERDRLQQLTGGAPVPAQPAAVQPPKN